MWNGKCGIIYGKCVNTHYWGLHGWKKKRNFALELEFEYKITASIRKKRLWQQRNSNQLTDFIGL